MSSLPPSELSDLIARARALEDLERRAFLDEHCPDAETRRKVETALSRVSMTADPNAPTLATPAPDSPDRFHTLTVDSGTGATAEPPVPTPDRIGKYEIVYMLGAGGMGAVYLARQERPRRDVALKLIRPGLASAELLRRFEFEAEVLGRLHHPGIAQIYEAGTHQTEFGPQPYFAMELVKGERLSTYLNQRGLKQHERLELFARICDAVQHAHQQGVVHRDLKPSNILVTHDGQPKILDFGVARATDADVQQTVQTDVGQLLGTLPYMSPEQVSQRAGEVDTRSDVYALGVVLFEILTGKLPYNLREHSVYEAARIIQDQEPTRLSTLKATLRGDVETIAAKALEKDKSRRYQSAADLAADIRRHLADEPIVARPASTWYQLTKFTRRHRGLVAGMALAFVALIAGVAVSTTMAFREAAQRRTAEQARANLEVVTDFQARMLQRVKPHSMGKAILADLRQRIESSAKERGISEKERQAQLAAFDQAVEHVNVTDAARSLLETNILTPAVEAVAEQFAEQPIVEARMRHALASLYRSQGLFDKALAQIRRAVDIRQKVLGQEHRDTLRSRSLEAMIDFDLGRYADTETGLNAVIPEWERLCGPNDKDTLTAKMCLAVLYMSTNRNAQAKGMLENVLDAQTRVLGPEDPDTLTTQSNLAMALFNLHKYNQAIPLFEKTLQLRTKQLGEDAAATIKAKRHLAQADQYTGRRDEAVRLTREALDGVIDLYGERHPETLDAMKSLVDVLNEQSRYKEAEPIARRALTLSRDLFGEKHPSTIDAYDDLGRVLDMLGKYAEASDVFAKALALAREVLGKDKPRTMDLVTNLGIAYWYQGRLEDAEASFTESLEYARRRFGENHPETAAAMNTLAILYTRQGRLDEAEPLVRKSIEIYRATQGPNSLSTLKSEASLAHLLYVQGKATQAMDYYADLYERVLKALGPEHQVALETAFNLAVVYDETDHDEQAANLLTDLLERRRRLFGPGHRQTLDVAWRLAVIRHDEGRDDEARSLMADVIRRRRETASADDTNAEDLHDLALALLECPFDDLADVKEALTVVTKANEMTGHKNTAYLSTLAKCYFKTGAFVQAVETQEHALELLPPKAPARELFEADLAEYRKSLAGEEGTAG